MNVINLIRPLVLAAAKRDKDPATYAELLLDNIPEAMHAQLLEGLQSETWRGFIDRIEPRLMAEHPAWTEELRDAMIETLTDEGDEGAEEEEQPETGFDGAAPPDINSIPPAGR